MWDRTGFGYVGFDNCVSSYVDEGYAFQAVASSLIFKQPNRWQR